MNQRVNNVTLTTGIKDVYYFGACDRCHGDFVFEADLYGKYFRCLQCGRTIEQTTEQTAKLTDGAGARLVETAAAELVA